MALALGVAVVIFVAFFSVRYMRTGPPWLAFVAAANVVLFVLSYFTLLYWSYGTSGKHGNWSASLSHWDALYVALGTLTTGTGTLTATSEFARRLLSMQMIVDLVVITLVAGVVVYKLTDLKKS